MFWILVFSILNSDGTMNITVEWPVKPEYNSERSCEQVGRIKANELQTKLGTNNHRVFWICKDIPYSEIAKTLPPNP